MPPESDSTNAGQLQPPSVDLEAVAVLLEAEARKAIAALEPGKSWRFACLDTTKESLKRFVQVGDNDLQDVAVGAFGIGIERLVRLDLCKLLILTYRLATLLIVV
jgi:hypothetical protein